MGEVVNLRLARKARARDEAQAKATANRARFGRSKAERRAEEMEAARRDRTLDGAARSGGPVVDDVP